MLNPASSRLPLRITLVVVLVVAAAMLCLPARGQVYVQDSPAAAEMLAAAEDRLSKEEPDEAARLVQQVLDEHGGKLLELSENRYAEARRVAERLLKRSEPLRSAYVQLHEPLGAQLLAQAGTDEQRLLDVLHRYGMTEAGLSAALRLAGLSLEAGQGDQAAIALAAVADHPLLDRHRAAWVELSAAAALLRDRDSRFGELLKQVAADAQRQKLQKLAASMQRRDGVVKLNALDVLPSATPPQAGDAPLWARALGGAERFLIDNYRADQTQVDSMAEDGRYLNVIPLVVDEVMYVNDGQTVWALEPSSGFALWSTEVTDSGSSMTAFAQTTYNRWLPTGADLNLLAAAGDKLVGVAGYSFMVTNYPYYRNDAESILTTLDRDSGEVLWKRRPADIAEELGDGFWYGRPVVSQGRVYAMLRLRQRTQFTDAWIIAFDLHTGETVWQRHLASTAADRQASPRLAHIALEDGWLYVDTCLGTVAKISAADGAVEWLTISPIGEDAQTTASHRPWQASAPLLVDAGLIVMDEWADAIRVFDPATGAVKKTLPANEWNRPLYMLRVDGDVLAVGSKVSRLSGADLSEKWVLDAGSIRGRAAVTANRMYLPADAAVQVVDLETGKVTGVMKVAMPANILVMEGQLVAAQREGLVSYSSWDIASRQLEKRIGDNMKDAGPLMAMAWLAFRTSRHEELLASLDRAIEAVNNDPARRAEQAQRLFEQVMEMATDTDQATPELRLELFDRLAAVTSTPDHEVVYRLAYAETLVAMERHAEAVEQYQTILAEPTYRRRLYTHETGSRQAALEAQRRLTDLIEKHGRELYAPYDAFAQQQFAELLDQADPAPLVELSEAYPLSSVTVQALTAAADRSAEQDHHREAIALLRRAAQLTRKPEQIAQLYGRQAELYEQMTQPHRARRVLRSLAASFPDIDPIRAGQPVDVNSWMTQLSQHPDARGAVARLKLPLSPEPRVLEGRLMRPLHRDAIAAPADMLLLRVADKLELRSAGELEAMWQADSGDDDDERLLSIDRQRVLLGSLTSGAVRMLDAATGTQRWADAEVRQKLSAIRPAATERARNANEAEFRQLLPAMAAIPGRDRDAGGSGQLMTAVSDVSLAIADQQGRVVVLQADSGKIAWQGATVARNATHLLLDGRHLMIAGLDEDEVPVLCVYDAQSGLLLHRLSNPKRQNILWMGLSEQGLLIYLSSTQMEAFDLDRGQSTWVAKPGVQLAGNDIAWISGDRLVVWTAESDLLFVNVNDGQVVNRVPIRGTIQVQQLTAVGDVENWFIAGTDRALGFDRDGKLLWQDAVSDPTQYLDMLLTERHVLMLGAPMDGQLADARGRKIYIIDRVTGLVAHQHALTAPQHMEFLHAADGKLLISGDGLTAVFTAK